LTRQRKESRQPIKVLFDSFLQPFSKELIGSVGTRQMLYRAGPIFRSMFRWRPARGNRIVVTGQLLDMSDPGVSVATPAIVLLNMRGHVVHAVTNQFGEFMER